MQHQNQGPVSLVPPGLVATRTWLRDKGVNRHTIDNWLKSGQLVAAARGVFKRPDTELTWQGTVCSLQRMGTLLTPGGLTALELQGITHYVSPANLGTIRLYGQPYLPAWMNTLLPDTNFLRHYPLEFDADTNADLRFDLVPWKTEFLRYGYEKQPLHISSPELAILEVLMDVPRLVSFEHASNLIQGLPTLSPRAITLLLERCRNVKVKRLFLWFAERNQSPWFKKISLEKFSVASGTLGSGKRVIAEAGKLDSKYLITVPPEMVRESYG